MVDRWTVDEDVDVLEDEFVDLVPASRGRKLKKKTPVRVEGDEFEDDRQDKRRKRRWEAPPHKRVNDFDPI